VQYYGEELAAVGLGEVAPLEFVDEAGWHVGLRAARENDATA